MTVDRKRVRAVQAMEAMGFSWDGAIWIEPESAPAGRDVSRESDALHAILMERAGRLAGCVEDSGEEDELRQIVELQVQRLSQRLAEKKLGLSLHADALDWIASIGYDPVYGARPLKRAIQRELETPIAKGILGGQFIAGHTIAVDVEHERLRFAQLDPDQLPVIAAEEPVGRV